MKESSKKLHTVHRLQQSARHIPPVNPISSHKRSIITPEYVYMELPRQKLPFNFYSEAVRRIAESGIPVVPYPRSMALISQAKNMAALHRKRKQFARLPPKIPINQLPRIRRRTDAILRPQPKLVNKKFNRSTSTSFIDKLLQSQQQLHSFEHIQMQG